MPRLDRDRLFGRPPLPEEEVDIPELGGSVLMRQLDYATMREIGSRFEDKSSLRFEAAFISACLAEPELTPEDLETLASQVSGATWQALAEAATRINGASDGQAKAAREAFREED